MPRAELSALVTLVEIVEVGSNIIYIGDNLSIIKLFNKGPDVCRRSSNADLFKLLFQYMEQRDILLTAFCIPSHLDNPQAVTKKGVPKTRPDWVQDYDIKGNNEAGRLACRAAEIAKIPELLFLSFKECVETLYAVQNRLATIITHLPQRKVSKNNPVPKPAPETKEHAISSSEHKITVVQNTVQCSSCFSQCNLNSACFWDFVKSKCHPAHKPSTFSNIAIVGSVTIGKQVSHASHKMYVYRGIKYCSLCGYMAMGVMRALAKTCKGVEGRTIHGQRVLDALAAGVLPQYVSEWPAS